MHWHIYLDANDIEIRIDSVKPLPVDMFEQPVEVYDILVILYQAGEEVVRVGKGPNKGKKIEYVNVVKAVMKIGVWQGGNLTLALSASRSGKKPGEEAVVLIQNEAGDPVVAVVKA